eukprot:CAMPEP_0202464288 /NCGR_PEP_ID=MMETSP1360-20130828/61456_1 /ASSEMBLY_ACC=CAM_ASM_000848 /TAXON_ID=515479 /ORGANISM="Licmophora paradoxa, Strain CCMP2313" /LENGTH=52 /DNA_ID=CAMNT_0049087543 /DNA_START=21 /DNA_END=175 /DNA_ORIENTATION=-
MYIVIVDHRHQIGKGFDDIFDGFDDRTFKKDWHEDEVTFHGFSKGVATGNHT